MLGGKKSAAKDAADPRLWRPVSIKDADPREFAYLKVEGVDSEIRATIYRWPRVGDSGRLDLQAHCSLRAPKPGRKLSFGFLPGNHLTDRRGFRLATSVPSLGPGEVAAIFTADKDFWERSEDLEGWSKLSLPVVKLTDEANAVERARFEPVAWTIWRDWLGQAPLIAHVARLAAGEIRTGTGQPVSTSIEARVGEDTESFTSSASYLSLATPQALERPDSVAVRVGDPRLWLKLTVARKRDRERKWLKNAVLLEAGSSDPAKLDAVTALHDRIAAAVRRGEPQWGAKGSSTSVAGFRPLKDDGSHRKIPRSWRAKAARRSSRYLVGIPTAVSFALAFALNFGWKGLLAVAVLTTLSFLGIVTLWPGVEFTARRSELLARLAVRGFLPLIGAIGAVVLRNVLAGETTP